MPPSSHEHSVPSPALVGLTIAGSHRIDAALRSGNMGAVYLSTQLSVGRKVALKVVERRKVSEERALERFLQEARMISRLEHPNIVRLYDFGEDKEQGVLFLAMEFIDGPTLSDVLQTNRLKQELTLDLGAQICRALIESHAQGVVHRDLKPANILLARMSDGSLQLKVVDFGVARALEINKQLTTDGAICGTPRYMAPEQAKQQGRVDGRADLYNLGLILYEMVCGYPPFDAEGAIELIIKHIHEPVIPLGTFLSPQELDPELAGLIHALLAKTPSERPQTAFEVLEVLEGLRVTHLSAPSIRLNLTQSIPEALGSRLLRLIPAAGQALMWQPETQMSQSSEAEREEEMEFVSIDTDALARVVAPLPFPPAFAAQKVASPLPQVQKSLREAPTQLTRPDPSEVTRPLAIAPAPAFAPAELEAVSQRRDTLLFHASPVTPSRTPHTPQPPVLGAIAPKTPFAPQGKSSFSQTMREIFLGKGAQALKGSKQRDGVVENTAEALFMEDQGVDESTERVREHLYVDDGHIRPSSRSNRGLLAAFMIVSLIAFGAVAYMLNTSEPAPSAQQEDSVVQVSPTQRSPVLVTKERPILDESPPEAPAIKVADPGIASPVEVPAEEPQGEDPSGPGVGAAEEEVASPARPTSLPRKEAAVPARKTVEEAAPRRSPSPGSLSEEEGRQEKRKPAVDTRLKKQLDWLKKK